MQAPYSYPKSVENEGRMPDSPGGGRVTIHLVTLPTCFPPGDHFMGKAGSVWFFCDVYTRLVKQKSSAQLGGPQVRAQIAL